MSITFEIAPLRTDRQKAQEVTVDLDIDVLLADVFDKLDKKFENNEDLEKLAYLTQDTLRWACDETRGGMGLDKTCQYFGVPGYGKFAEGHEPSFELKLAQIIQLYQIYLDLKKDHEEVDESLVLLPMPNSQIAKILPPLFSGDFTKPILGRGTPKVNGLPIVADKLVLSILSGSKNPAKYKYLTPGTIGYPSIAYQDIALANKSEGLGDYELQLVFDNVALQEFETSSSDIRTLLAIFSDPLYFNKFIDDDQKHWILGRKNDCGLMSGLRLGVNIIYEEYKNTRFAVLRIWDEKEAKDNHDNFNDKKALCAFSSKCTNNIQALQYLHGIAGD
jgi:hypothetical protein